MTAIHWESTGKTLPRPDQGSIRDRRRTPALRSAPGGLGRRHDDDPEAGATVTRVADHAINSCSSKSRLLAEAPIGTASALDHVFVEIPLPWPVKIRDAAGYPASLDAALERVAEQIGRAPKVLAIAPDPRWSSPGRVRVLAFRSYSSPIETLNAPASGIGPLSRYEDVLYPDDVGPAVEAFFTSGLNPLSATPRALPQRRPPRDLFVCTHGTTDGCCGKLGLPVYQTLQDLSARDGAGLRVWRTSHIGGHRFAPTLIDFPMGRYWAYLDLPSLRQLVRRDASPSRLAPKYRGRVGLGPLAQQLERELFCRHGWAWDTVAVSAEVEVDGITYPAGLEPSGTVEKATVRMHYALTDGSLAGFAAGTVAHAGDTQAGGCRGDDASVPRYRLVDVEERRYPARGA